MPKICRRRSAPMCEIQTVPNMSAAPRKVSFEASEDDDSSSQSSTYSSSSLPNMDLLEIDEQPEDEPQAEPHLLSLLSSSLPISTRTLNMDNNTKRKKQGLLRRPSPSLCLSAMGATTNTKKKPKLHVNNYNSPVPATTASEGIPSPCWGQFVDVIPDEVDSDRRLHQNHVPYFSFSRKDDQSAPYFAYKPYPALEMSKSKRRVNVPRRRKHQTNNKGFLPGLILAIPSCEDHPSSEDTTEQHQQPIRRSCLSSRDILGTFKSLSF